MSQDEIILELQVIAGRLRNLFPDGNLYLSVTQNHLSVGIHQIKTYAQATDIFRRCGVQKRTKQTWADPQPRMVLQGRIGNIPMDVYVNELSPTCRVEKVTEKIPKQQTVDTGEFIEVERVKIVCGEKEAA